MNEFLIAAIDDFETKLQDLLLDVRFFLKNKNTLFVDKKIVIDTQTKGADLVFVANDLVYSIPELKSIREKILTIAEYSQEISEDTHKFKVLKEKIKDCLKLLRECKECLHTTTPNALLEVDAPDFYSYVTQEKSSWACILY